VENQTPSNTKSKNKLLRVILCLTTLAVTTTLGIAAAIAYHSVAKVVYKSHAVIKIDDRETPSKIEGLDFSSLKGKRHDQLIGQVNVVHECLEKNRLFDLRCFRDLPEDLIVSSVVENLAVSQNADEPSIYELEFCCSHPDESQEVLNCLLASYRAHVAKGQEDIVEPYRSGLVSASEAVEKKLDNPDQYSEEELTQLKQSKAEILKALIDLDAHLTQVRVVSLLEAATFGEPVWPILPLILAVGAGIGLAIGIGLILLWAFIYKMSNL